MRIYAAAMLLTLAIGILWQRPAVIALAAGMASVWIWMMRERNRAKAGNEDAA